MNILVGLDLNKNELLNARIQNLPSAPSSPVEGEVYFNSGDKKFYVWNGTIWSTWEIPPFDATTFNGQLPAYYLARANHTGTQLAATISDFDSQVRTNRLDQMAAPTADVSMNSHKITNLLAPTSGGDATNKTYVDNLVQGVDAHPSVRAASTVNLTLSGTQTVDGIALGAGERILVKNQTAPAENGIYSVAAGAWTRVNDADTWAELVAAYVFVEEGTTQADTAWLSTVDSGGTLGTTAVTWVQFSSASAITASNLGTGSQVFKSKVGLDLQFRKINAGSGKITVTENTNDISIDVVESALTHNNIGGTLSIAKGGTGQITAPLALAALGGVGKFAATIGNGVLTTITVNHNLNTTDVVVGIKEVGGSLSVVYADIVVTDANNVAITFSVAPTTNQYRVIVMG